MTNRTAANRYARALFDVALAEQTSLQAVEADLSAVVDLFASHSTLQQVLLNPAVPAPRKRSAVAEIAKHAGLAPVLAKLLVLLAERDRLVLLPYLLAAYQRRLLDNQRVIRVEVKTAVPLTPERVQAIERSLAAATGRSVALTVAVDPSLIGGLVARVGGTVYDGSIARQLEKLKERLEARAGG